jgi:hypothetical protein
MSMAVPELPREPATGATRRPSALATLGGHAVRAKLAGHICRGGHRLRPGTVSMPWHMTPTPNPPTEVRIKRAAHLLGAVIVAAATPR